MKNTGARRVERRVRERRVNMTPAACGPSDASISPSVPQTRSMHLPGLVKQAPTPPDKITARQKITRRAWRMSTAAVVLGVAAVVIRIIQVYIR